MTDATKATEPMMNRKHAAALLDVAEVTLKRWARSGFGPKFVRMGTAKNSPVRYPRAWIVQWLAERAQ
jgi:predicted site-specific integrase-resolvase